MAISAFSPFVNLRQLLISESGLFETSIIVPRFSALLFRSLLHGSLVYCFLLHLVFEILFCFNLQATDSKPSTKRNSIICTDCEGNGKLKNHCLVTTFIFLIDPRSFPLSLELCIFYCQDNFFLRMHFLCMLNLFIYYFIFCCYIIWRYQIFSFINLGFVMLI